MTAIMKRLKRVHAVATHSYREREPHGRSVATDIGEDAMNGVNRFPLSGDVIQDINPINWWIRTGQQIGFININASRSGDVGLERKIVEDVASYGRQLGRVIDALEVLIARRPDDLTDDEIARVEAFRDLAAEIAAVKQASRPQSVLAAVDRVIVDVRAQQFRNPTLYNEAVTRFREAFS